MAVAAMPLTGVGAEFEFAAGPYVANELVVLELRLDEELSQPFSATLTLATPDEGVMVEPGELLGQDALVTMHLAAGDRYVHGIVAAVDRWDTGGEGAERNRYVVRVVPTLWKLGHRRNCRIFQHLSVPEIVNKVLTEGGVDFDPSFPRLSATYDKREYCVQYRESDLEFVSRLLEEEGIFYWFEHAEDAHRMVFCDAVTSCDELPDGPVVPFREPELHVGDEHVDEFLNHRQVRSTAVTLRDFDFLRPQTLVEAKADQGSNLEVYDYPGGLRGADRGDRARSRVRLEELQVLSDHFSGGSLCRRLAPGFLFELVDHPVDWFNGEYLVLSVHHDGSQPEVLSQVLAHVGGDDPGRGPRYHNEFRCIRRGTPYRPERRTQRPVIPGPQTAIVVGPAGEEIYTDAHGRIKVQFHWDREGRRDENASCWVRVSQAWAGPGWGALYLPRIGHEVVVEFLEGDPDRPVVTGSVYNGLNPPPVDLPAQKTQSTLRSATSPGGYGANELRFEDAAGSELVTLHAQKDLDVVVENDKTQHVGANETLTVDQNRSRSVGGDQTLLVEKDDTSTIHANQSLTVGRDRNTTVGGNHTENVGGSQSISVGGSSSITVAMAATETVALAKALNVGGAYAVSVGAAMNELVGAVKSEEIGLSKTENVGGKKTETVAGSRSLRVGGDLSEDVGKSRTLKVGKDLVLNVAGSMKHGAGKDYKLKAKSITISAGDEFVLKVGGATLTVKKSGDVVLKGANIQVKASGPLVLKGSPVSEN
ncbi:MAG TPA: type VI secretion system tip protein TssI/VgrG [Anaeromyxobacter sp.]|nr:type VI secretion system tip protein TssI/VgrG [Anaeromyxobacter sp.]